MNPYVKLNEYKKAILRRKINKCIEEGNDFTLWIFDIDDTLNRSFEATEKQLEVINRKATIEYMNSIGKKYHMPDDIREKQEECRDIKNQILEDYGKYNGAIDYSLIHNGENLYPNSIETLKYMLDNRDPNTFVIICSQRNPYREEVFKLERYYNYTASKNGESNLDAIICLPVFDLPYAPNLQRTMTSKDLAVMSELGIPSNYMNRCILVDDSSRVRRKFKEKGGIVIPAYMTGYDVDLEDEKDDRLRVITSFDPYILQTVYAKIQYDLKHYDETKNFKKLVR